MWVTIIRLLLFWKTDIEIDYYNDLPRILQLVKKFKRSDFLYVVGHDIFTGELSNYLARELNKSTSIVFHHMDFESYHAIKMDVSPEQLAAKFSKQTKILRGADIVVAIGPKLFESAKAKTEKRVEELIPGLHSIEEWKHSGARMAAVTFGRYDERTDKLKQMSLAVQGFSAYMNSIAKNVAEDYTLKVVGIRTKEEAIQLLSKNSESNRYLNILPLPYTENRQQLFDILRKSTACLMLSYHEGFGLAGYEAIAATVPLILSKNSGLYQLIVKTIQTTDFRLFGIYPVHIHATVDGSPNKGDIKAVVNALHEVHAHNKIYKNGIRRIRDVLKEKYDWNRAAQRFLQIILPPSGETSIYQQVQQKRILPTVKRNKIWKVLNSKIVTPFVANINFVKREVLEAQILHKSQTSDFVVLIGDHGMGKSALTRNFVRNQFLGFDHICWVNFQNNIKQSIVAAIFAASTEKLPTDSIDGLFQQVIYYMNQVEGNKLIIIDNLDDIDEFKNLLFDLKLQQWKIIVTSTKDIDLVPEANKVRVDTMTYEEAYQLHNNILGSPASLSLNEFEKMFPQSQLSPFLVEYFSYYLKKEILTDNKSDQLVPEKKASTLYRYFIPEANLLEFYATIFASEAVNFSTQEVEFLYLYSLMPSNFSNVDIIKEVLLLEFDLKKQNELIQRFIETGWISRNLVIHFLRQEIILRHTATIERILVKLLQFVSAKLKIVSGENPLEKLEYIPLASSLYAKASGHPLVFEVVYRLGILEFDLAKLNDAKLHQDVVINGADSAFLVGCANFEKGLIEERQGNYERSIELLKKSLEYFDSLSMEVVNAFSKISVVYGKIYYRNKTSAIREKILIFYNKAMTLLRQLIEKGIVEENNADLGTVYIDSAAVLSDLDDFQQTANDLFLSGIAIYEAQLSPKHPWIATTYNLYGNYLTKHNLSLALDYIWHSIEIREEIYKTHPFHYSLAESYHDYAEALFLSGKYTDALTFIDKAIVIRQREFEIGGETYKKRLEVSHELRKKIIDALDRK